MSDDLISALEECLTRARAGRAQAAAVFLGYEGGVVGTRVVGTVDNPFVTGLRAAMSALSELYGVVRPDTSSEGSLSAQGSVRPPDDVAIRWDPPDQAIPQRRQVVTSDPGSQGVQFRYSEGDELDEVLVAWPRHVHVEVMSFQHIWMGIALDDRRMVHCNFYLDLPEELRDRDDDDFEPAVRLRYRAEIDGRRDRPAVPGLVGRLATLLAETSARLPEDDPLRKRACAALEELEP